MQCVDRWLPRTFMTLHDPIPSRACIASLLLLFDSFLSETLLSTGGLAVFTIVLS